jgi:hypothetical protein
MAVSIELTDLANLQNESTAVAAINANNEAIEAAFADVLALDAGTLPNSMNAALDMNSNGIINLPAPASGLSPLRLTDYNTLISGGTIYVNNSIGVEFVMDGGGAQLGTGLRGILQVPFAGLITGVSVLGDQSGSVVVDIWKCSNANYAPPTHPAVADSITASALPTITAGTKYSDNVLTGWTKSFSANDVFAYNINSISNFTRLAICLTVTKTA